jgi:hypothetical protein
MKKGPKIFLSYSRKDSESAEALEQALLKRGLQVWRDVRSIAAGERWSDSIENGIREARGVVVLLTAASSNSEWVAYEYAFATGARIPIIAVVGRGGAVPGPIQRFQTVSYSQPRSVAKVIDDGIAIQYRAAAQERASAPKLVAKFQEDDGDIVRASSGKTPSLGMDLWIEDAPRQTEKVAFEILDQGFRDRRWTVPRARRVSSATREFLTEDMNSYGDVAIWARGVGTGRGNWTAKSMLYAALVRYYSGRSINTETRRGLAQIRKN